MVVVRDDMCSLRVERPDRDTAARVRLIRIC